MNPEELLFAPSHEWVHISESAGRKIATIGISDFAVEQLTDLVYLQLPEVGSRTTAAEPLGEIESVKAVSDVYAPVTGEVIEVNAELPDRLEQFSEDPFGAAWIAKVQIDDEAPLANLLDHAAYRRQCAEEA